MKKIILNEPFVSKRRKPKNLKNKDEHLFQHEYERKFNGSHYLVVTNPMIVNRSVYSLVKFRFFTKYTYFNTPKFLRFTKDLYKNLFRTSKSSISLDKAIWICDDKSSVYFHWIFDALTKYINLPDEIKKYQVILPQQYLIDWIVEFLDYLQIDYFVLDTNTKIKVKELYLPSYNAPSGNFNKDIVFRLRDEFLKNYEFDLSKLPEDKKIWINMEKHRRPIKNINEIRPILKKYNFDEVTFEDLTISKKIEILQSTNFLMGSHSSGLANMLFMRKGANIIDIRDSNDNVKNAFFTLSSELDLNYFYMERESKSSDTIIDPQKLDDLLSSIF